MFLITIVCLAFVQPSSPTPTPAKKQKSSEAGCLSVLCAPVTDHFAVKEQIRKVIPKQNMMSKQVGALRPVNQCVRAKSMMK